MTSRKTRRNEWTRNKQGGWTRSYGQRGMRVRLFQNRRNGTFYRVVWIPGKGRDITSLGTTDRKQAEELGKALLADLLRGNTLAAAPSVTLGALWERYSRECQSFLDSVPSTKRDYRSRADVLLGYFGEQCDVSTLTEHDIRVFEAKRKAGGITRRSGKVTGPVRAGSADADIVVLRIMLRWATTLRTPQGQRWLRDNPLQGVRRTRVGNPRRPVATWQRYQRTREAMRELAQLARRQGVWTQAGRL